MSLDEIMLRGAESLGIPLSAEQAGAFSIYHQMLTETNKVMNLTRVPDDPEESARRNYLDSIAVVHFFDDIRKEETPLAIDVGSGAGLPGIPLSIMLPEIRFTLLDSLGKRVKFLESVIAELGLNAEAVHVRAEDAGRDARFRESFDVAMARAVARLNVLSEYLIPFVKQGGHMLALKGPALEEELPEAKAAIEKLGGGKIVVRSLTVPESDYDHRAVWIKKARRTPAVYPRQPGMIKKQTL